MAVALCLFVCSVSAPVAIAQEKGKMVSFDIPAGEAVKALRQFSAQSGQQLLYSNDDLAGVKTNEVKGRLSVQEALDQLLAKTPLAASRDNSNGAVAVGRKADPNANRAIAESSGRPGSRKTEVTESGALKLDTFEVFGQKLLNMDIRRSQDDAQPYSIFDRQAIEQSGATNLEDFIRYKLTMNVQGPSIAQSTRSALGNSSQINLRGLGSDQTLILIDGHRVSSLWTNSNPSQSDINGIPIEAVERIEVLPTTASGIYGGSATGGVVNIILRRDYRGVTLRLTYENSFESDSARRRIDINCGFSLEGGKTDVLMAASFSDSNLLLIQDRDYLRNGRSLLLANNPSGLLGSTVPPLGSSPNISSTTGVNLTLKPAYGGTPLNSPITFVPIGYSGVASDNGAALVANAGRYNLNLATNPQIGGAAGDGGTRALTSAPETTAFMAMIRRQFTPSLQGFVDIAGSSNKSFIVTSLFSDGIYTVPAAAATNPFAQQIRVNVPHANNQGGRRSSIEERRFTTGMIAKLPGDWQTEADFAWSRTRFESEGTAGNATDAAGVSTGVINIVRDLSIAPLDSAPLVTKRYVTPADATLRDLTLRLGGALGRVSISSLIEYREEALGEQRIVNPASESLVPAKSQSVASGYVELKQTVIKPEHGITMLNEFEIQVAGRHDRYLTYSAPATVTPSNAGSVVRVKNEFSSSNPTVAIRAKLTDKVMLRASYGTGFLPPSISQLIASAPQSFTGASSVPNLLDPRRGNELVGSYTLYSGGGTNLKPEKSTSLSAGAVITPLTDGSLRISLDYVKIEKTDNILSLPLNQATIDNEVFLPGRIQRGPVVPGDSFGIGNITAIDVSLTNIAKADVEAFDLGVNYEKRTDSIGQFTFNVTATWQTHYRTQLVAFGPVTENAGISRVAAFGSSGVIPLKFRGNGSISWRKGPWLATISARYFDSYLVSTVASTIANQGHGGRIPSQSYVDLFASYRLPGRSEANKRMAWLTANSELQLGVRNIFNTKAPLDAANGSSLYSQLADPRGAVYSISIRKGF